MPFLKENSHYKIAIIGAGPAGSSCAIALSNEGVKNILLVDSGEYDKFRIGESIPPEIKPIFLKLGIYKAFLSEKHDPCYGSCSYWGDDRRGYNDSLFSPYGHGWHLDRRRFNYFLSQEAKEAGTELLTNTEFLDSEQIEGGCFKLTFRDAQKSKISVTADFVIDASGSRCVFASRQGSKRLNTDSLVCLGARFSIINSTQTVSKQTHLESVEYGWWYAAQLPGNVLLVTLYTDADTIKQKGLQHLKLWLCLLEETQHTGKLVSDLEIIDEKLKAFHAPSFRLDKVVGKNWMAIGDTASAFDPITSQGIIKSMSDAIIASEIIVKHFAGERNKLQEFEKIVTERYEQYLSMRKYFYRLENRWPDSLFWNKFQNGI